jgi:lipopolysaccharide heptosyltransferase I
MSVRSPPVLPADLRQLEFSRILLIKPTALGDVVHTLPVLVKLRRRYPQARIDWLVTPENAELVRCHPALTEAVLFDRRAWRRDRLRALGDTLGLLRRLRAARYDLAIDLHGQLRSGFFALASGAPVRIGYDRPRRGPGVNRHGWAGAREFSWLASTHRMRIRDLQVHAIDRYLWLGDLLGLDDSPPDQTLHLPPEAEAAAAGLLRPLGETPVAVIAPGTLWETKHWRPEGFAEVARRLSARGFAVVITGTAQDRARAAAILAAAPRALDLCGRTSPAELGALLRRARVAVTNDSGAMHLAVAAGTPVVAVFGPTDPVRVGPYGQAERVVMAGVACSPCFLRRLAQCPHGHACMETVTAEMVWREVEQVLA